jgi:hypothetical protein
MAGGNAGASSAIQSRRIDKAKSISPYALLTIGELLQPSI